MSVIMKNGKPDFSICWSCGNPNNWTAEPCRTCWKKSLQKVADSNPINLRRSPQKHSTEIFQNIVFMVKSDKI